MKILMVLTSHDQLGNTCRKTGFLLEEFAAPYFVFKDAWVELTLASPKGGQPPIDPKSDLPENQTPAMARFKQDTADAPLKDEQWVESNGSLMVMLAIQPPADCAEENLEVHVMRRNRPKTAIVEFDLDPRAQGTGCYSV